MKKAEKEAEKDFSNTVEGIGSMIYSYLFPDSAGKSFGSEYL
jgi:hypothetical protein